MVAFVSFSRRELLNPVMCSFIHSPVLVHLGHAEGTFWKDGDVWGEGIGCGARKPRIEYIMQ